MHPDQFSPMRAACACHGADSAFFKSRVAFRFLDDIPKRRKRFSAPCCTEGLDRHFGAFVAVTRHHVLSYQDSRLFVDKFPFACKLLVGFRVSRPSNWVLFLVESNAIVFADSASTSSTTSPTNTARLVVTVITTTTTTMNTTPGLRFVDTCAILFADSGVVVIFVNIPIQRR